MESDTALEVSKSIITEFYRYFASEEVDNLEHILAIKRIVKATCCHFSDKASEIEKELLDHAFDLFLQEWFRLTEEDEENHDRKEELEEAKRVFFQTYQYEKHVW